MAPQKGLNDVLRSHRDFFIDVGIFHLLIFLKSIKLPLLNKEILQRRSEADLNKNERILSMKIGTTKELKNNEYRVGLTPDGVYELASEGHEISVETSAGLAAGFTDKDYQDAGAKIVQSAKEVYDNCEMICKVKEPEENEYDLLRNGQILYTYLHLASNPKLTEILMKKNITGIAYETIRDEQGNLPCLRPMSQIAGRLSIQEGAKFIEREYGGRGILIGGVPGVERGKIVILGGGVAGTYAAKAAVGIDAQVTLLDRSANRLAYIEDVFGASVTTLYLTEANVKRALSEADLVIGAILVPGGATPHIIRREHLKLMKPGAVIVDISIDQGGCCETSHVTTHDNPVFLEEGIVHYCVGNMPGAVPYTSTVALANTTIKYAKSIAKYGPEKAFLRDKGLLMGLNTYKGFCTNENLANSLGLQYKAPEKLILL